jgi:hypothetical protein
MRKLLTVSLALCMALSFVGAYAQDTIYLPSVVNGQGSVSSEVAPTITVPISNVTGITNTVAISVPVIGHPADVHPENFPTCTITTTLTITEGWRAPTAADNRTGCVAAHTKGVDITPDSALGSIAGGPPPPPDEGSKSSSVSSPQSATGSFAEWTWVCPASVPSDTCYSGVHGLNSVFADYTGMTPFLSCCFKSWNDFVFISRIVIGQNYSFTCPNGLVTTPSLQVGTGYGVVVPGNPWSGINLRLWYAWYTPGNCQVYWLNYYTNVRVMQHIETYALLQNNQEIWYSRLWTGSTYVYLVNGTVTLPWAGWAPRLEVGNFLWARYQDKTSIHIPTNIMGHVYVANEGTNNLFPFYFHDLAPALQTNMYYTSESPWNWPDTCCLNGYYGYGDSIFASANY